MINANQAYLVKHQTNGKGECFCYLFQQIDKCLNDYNFVNKDKTTRIFIACVYILMKFINKSVQRCMLSSLNSAAAVLVLQQSITKM